MGPQGEPAVAGALTQDHIQAEVGDGPAEPPVEIKPRDMKHISLRFRKKRRESSEPVEPAAIGMVTLSLHSHPSRPTASDLGQSPGSACWAVKWGDASPWWEGVSGI